MFYECIFPYSHQMKYIKFCISKIYIFPTDETCTVLLVLDYLFIYLFILFYFILLID